MKRSALLRLETADSEDANDDEGEFGPRPAPNTNFLGRLVRGVATGNQRQMDATTSNAANMVSCGMVAQTIDDADIFTCKFTIITSIKCLTFRSS